MAKLSQPAKTRYRVFTTVLVVVCARPKVKQCFCQELRDTRHPVFAYFQIIFIKFCKRRLEMCRQELEISPLTNYLFGKLITCIKRKALLRIPRLDSFLSSIAGSCLRRNSKHSLKWARRFFSNLLCTSLVPALSSKQTKT